MFLQFLNIKIMESKQRRLLEIPHNSELTWTLENTTELITKAVSKDMEEEKKKSARTNKMNERK